MIVDGWKSIEATARANSTIFYHHFLQEIVCSQKIYAEIPVGPSIFQTNKHNFLLRRFRVVREVRGCYACETCDVTERRVAFPRRVVKIRDLPIRESCVRSYVPIFLNSLPSAFPHASLYRPLLYRSYGLPHPGTGRNPFPIPQNSFFPVSQIRAPGRSHSGARVLSSTMTNFHSRTT